MSNNNNKKLPRNSSYNLNNQLIMSEGNHNNNSCGGSKCSRISSSNISNIDNSIKKNNVKNLIYIINNKIQNSRSTNNKNTTYNLNYKNNNKTSRRSSLSSSTTKLLATTSLLSSAAAATIQPQPPHPTIKKQKYRLRFNIGLSGLKTTSFLTILMLVCLETVLLSTVSNCAKTFYMHWNTSNSIFRIDNTDHIIDVNKGNLAFEFDQVHIICPVYEPGTFENETEKYIIYNVSKVEYETCRITNADPRVIAICDKPQKLMFFTITFRPFTPQPGGLEFLPGNDYYFISTSSKDDLYRRIGGRCTTNNMKVVFKVCCAPEDKNNRTHTGGMIGSGTNSGISIGNNNNGNQHIINNNNQHHNNNININGQSTSSSSPGGGTSINTNIDQFNRIPMQQNSGGDINNNGGIGIGGGGQQQTGIRINNMPQNPSQNGMHSGGFIPPMTNINTNSSNVVQSTMSWSGWGNNAQNGGNNGGMIQQHSTPVTTIGIQPHFYPPHMTSPRPNINSAINNHSNYSPSHKPTKKTSEYDKHPNEVVKNEELTYNSGATSTITATTFKFLNFMKSKTKLSPSLLITFSNTKLANKLLLLLSNVCNPIIILTTILVILTNNLFQLKYVSSRVTCRTSITCQR